MNNPTPGTPAWLAQVEEEIIDPERPIVDPHHHLWQRPGGSYILEDLQGRQGACPHRLHRPALSE